MKTYRGSAAAARHYVEADRGRADDYYLAEGTGIADRYTASPDAGVRRLAPLSGDAYEAWVAGVDPDTGVPKGRLRHDDQAVRFVEVIVNGPKSWSLAAELHPQISRAYDDAQDRAATQIVRWLAQHSTTRVGPRGRQVQVPVAEIEAVTVRHHTSRSGDPHRHLHLQINARVFAEGQWRGLHTVGVRDSLAAINGIGHAAVMTDPGFREALAAYGLTLDEAGEVVQLRELVGPFSARAAQIGRNIDRYETGWRAANPGREPGPALRRAWDARAWADARPDKVVPRDGAELTQGWVEELRALGYRDAASATGTGAVPVGRLDRDRAVGEVLSRLAARRSGWNAADVRGEVEQLIARANVVTESSIRGELAEDLTARTLGECVPLLDRVGVPEHIRTLTSPHVLEVEADLATRLAARGDAPSSVSEASFEAAVGLDDMQRKVAAALAGDTKLVVVEGAAGAGKTTTLAAARTVIEQRGRRLRVVTPTLKAARVAGQQVGTDASSGAWLAYQHGFRWDENGSWTRLAPGMVDPHTRIVFHGPSASAVLQSGDVLLVDEAGMLDQDTARALLTIADEHQARVALVGDRHQLPAIGRGGVLDLAARWAAPEACLALDRVHRFTQTVVTADGAFVTVADDEYARLSLAMRTGSDPGAVFDALLARGQIRLHPSDADRIVALAGAAVEALAEGAPAVVVADTREQVAMLNAATHDRLVAAGRVDDTNATTTHAGQRIAVGDRVATRRNDGDLGVANRDIWTITTVALDGYVTVTGDFGDRAIPADYVRAHVELAYASTVHGVQGETASTAHLLVGEHTSAASAYVGMTRGRTTNVAHLSAADLDDARDQWVAVFGRDRADLGPAQAAELAAAEASRYVRLRPLEQVLTELRDAWTAEADSVERLAAVERRRDLLVDVVALTGERDATVPALKQAYHDARIAAKDAEARAGELDRVVTAQADGIASKLQQEWDRQRGAARRAAQVVRDGAGRLGQRRSAVHEATEHLLHWSAAWQPYHPSMPTNTDDVVAVAGWFDDTPRIHDAFDQYAGTAAEQDHPHYLTALGTAENAVQHRDDRWRTWRAASLRVDRLLAQYGSLAHHPDPASYLVQVEHTLSATRAQADIAHNSVTVLLAEPALRAQPKDRITSARDQWRADRDTAAARQRARSGQLDADAAQHRTRQHKTTVPASAPEQAPGISR
ncbi:MAG: relaxase domain-containing protein [Actinomycetota bacterium]|nr:relaxase domain-containing protein [Actinomycetota bacterium]